MKSCSFYLFLHRAIIKHSTGRIIERKKVEHVIGLYLKYTPKKLKTEIIKDMISCKLLKKCDNYKNKDGRRKLLEILNPTVSECVESYYLEPQVQVSKASTWW